MPQLKREWLLFLLLFGVLLIAYQYYRFSQPSRYITQSSFDSESATSPTQIFYSATQINSSFGRGWKHGTLGEESDPKCTASHHFRSWDKRMVTKLGTPIRCDCRKLVSGDARAEIEKSNLTTQVNLWKKTKPWERFATNFKTENCSWIRKEFSNLFYVSEMEKKFPIAFILVVYTNPGQVLRFLKSIYRPHNLYCIHPDARQSQNFADYFKAVERCINNVFVVSKPVNVYYGDISILDAQLHCMQDLMKYPATYSWKYVINLSGREIPLKTNRELVQILMKLNGYSAVNLVDMSSFIWKDRFEHEIKISKNGDVRDTSIKLPDLPEGIEGKEILKSTAYLAASRQFVHFILNDSFSLEFHKYLQKVRSCEEHYYATLYGLSRAEGGKPPEGKVPIVNEAVWTPPMTNCKGGQVVHRVCILTAPDLHVVEGRRLRQNMPVLFFNKYFLELDPTPMDCMEEQLVRTNMVEYWQDCT